MHANVSWSSRWRWSCAGRRESALDVAQQLVHRRGELERARGRLHPRPGAHQHGIADPLTLADFCVASTLTYVEVARLPVADFGHVRHWFGALDEQPGWRASTPPPM